jgi:hypothetical protein
LDPASGRDDFAIQRIDGTLKLTLDHGTTAEAGKNHAVFGHRTQNSAGRDDQFRRAWRYRQKHE